MARPISSSFWPVLSAVINPQDFDALLPHAINSNVGQGWEQELPRSFLASDTAKMRPLFEGLDGAIHFANGRLLVMRMVLFEIIADAL
jgi:hypothetical protein